MNVLIVEPMKAPYEKEIESGLESLQHEVDGYLFYKGVHELKGFCVGVDQVLGQSALQQHGIICALSMLF